MRSVVIVGYPGVQALDVNAATITNTGSIASWPNPTAILDAGNHRSH